MKVWLKADDLFVGAGLPTFLQCNGHIFIIKKYIACTFVAFLRFCEKNHCHSCEKNTVLSGMTLNNCKLTGTIVYFLQWRVRLRHHGRRGLTHHHYRCQGHDPQMLKSVGASESESSKTLRSIGCTY